MEEQEKERLCQIISRWEFTDFRSPDNHIYAKCAEALAKSFAITSIDLASYRTEQIAKIIGAQDGKLLDALNNISDMRYQELRESIKKSLSTARKLVEQSAKAQQQSKTITEKFSKNEPSVRWGRRSDGSAWISVGDPAGFPHYACDYYGDLNTGPRSVADFSEPVPEWVVIALDLNHSLKGKN